MNSHPVAEKACYFTMEWLSMSKKNLPSFTSEVPFLVARGQGRGLAGGEDPMKGHFSSDAWESRRTSPGPLLSLLLARPLSSPARP